MPIYAIIWPKLAAKYGLSSDYFTQQAMVNFVDMDFGINDLMHDVVTILLSSFAHNCSDMYVRYL